jgi:hypothetical protein
MQQRSRSPRSELEVGCIFPIAVVAACLLGLEVIIGTRLAGRPAAPTEVSVRIVDDGAPGGPAVLATAVVPLR